MPYAYPLAPLFGLKCVSSMREALAALRIQKKPLGGARADGRVVDRTHVCKQPAGLFVFCKRKRGPIGEVRIRCGVGLMLY
jgi:hypothetical protein